MFQGNPISRRRALLWMGAAGATAAILPVIAFAVDNLKPGEFTWHPELAPDGPVAIIVSLPEQRVYVYRNGVEIAVSTCSTGKPGHETPTGVFTILEKDKNHHSSTYNNAPMPNMERLTWSGRRAPCRAASRLPGLARLRPAAGGVLAEALHRHPSRHAGDHRQRQVGAGRRGASRTGAVGGRRSRVRPRRQHQGQHAGLGDPGRAGRSRDDHHDGRRRRRARAAPQPARRRSAAPAADARRRRPRPCAAAGGGYRARGAGDGDPRLERRQEDHGARQRRDRRRGDGDHRRPGRSARPSRLHPLRRQRHRRPAPLAHASASAT